jgi:hypothetical protein
MRARLAVALALAATTAGCGGDDADHANHAAPKAVQATLALERPIGAGADAGTAAGHHQPDAIASTSLPRFTIRGTVRPAGSAVTIRDVRSGDRTTATVSSDGRFAARIDRLRRGQNDFVIHARAPGHRPWSADVTITRR